MIDFETIHANRQTYLSRTRRLAAYEAQFARLAQERAKGSTAERYDLSMKAAENLTRDLTSKSGLRKTGDFRARAQSDRDCTIYGCAGEVKCGGTVSVRAKRNGLPYTKENDFTERDILPNAKYVVFPIIDRIHSIDDLVTYTAIMSRDEFLTLLEAYATTLCPRMRKGSDALHTIFHITAGVVAFQKQPLDRLRRLLEDLLDQGDIMSLDAYLTEQNLY